MDRERVFLPCLKHNKGRASIDIFPISLSLFLFIYSLLSVDSDGQPGMVSCEMDCILDESGTRSLF